MELEPERMTELRAFLAARVAMVPGAGRPAARRWN